MEISKEKLKEWIDRLDEFEYDVNRQCSVKNDMIGFLKEVEENGT